jgi:tetratricopeptide (TPR) repeat protein
MRKVVRRVLGFATLLLVGFNQAPARTPQIYESIFARAVSVQGRNTIYGTVSGESHRPVPDVYVELLDDFSSSIGQAKTDGTGRFTFNNLNDGRYIIRVRPYGTDYMEQTREVVLASISSSRASDLGTRSAGSATEHVDIALVRNERANSGPFAAAPDVIFAQNIPPPAKKSYEEGLAYLRDRKEKEGFESLKKAIETFPDYYLALDRLGAEYSARGLKEPVYLQAGFALLSRAVEINPRGFSSVFGLGWTQYQLGMNAEAIENLKRATTLYGKAADTYLWLGKALRRAKVPDQAEIAFKRAHELSGGKLAEVHWQLAGLYSDQKRYKEAADEMELFLKTAPKEEDPEKIKALIKQLREKANAK